VFAKRSNFFTLNFSWVQVFTWRALCEMVECDNTSAGLSVQEICDPGNMLHHSSGQRTALVLLCNRGWQREQNVK
jgi:hypothetical protein